MAVLTRTLITFFVLLVIAGGLLFAVHDYQTSRDLAQQLQEEQVQAGKRQVHQFSDAVRRTLDRYQFRDLIDKTRGEFVQFEKLSEALLNSSEYISYIHWKNGRGETLLFKGADSLQKFIINEHGVTYYQATTSEVREIHVNTPGHVDTITDITTPVLMNDPRMGTISLGIDENKVLARAQEAAEKLRSRTVAYSSIGFLLVGLSFIYFTFLARKVTRLSDRLQQQSRMAYVGTLASGLVHEIRNPLNGISLNLSLLEEETREAGDPRLIASMERILGRVKPNLAHLENISQEFLMFAKPPKLVLALADVGEVVADTAQFLRPQCDAARIHIEVERGLLPQILIDSEKIRQVLLNLAVNAIHAMPNGGTLVFRVLQDGTHVALDVQDTGCGIPPENLQKIFTLFFSTKERGVGLGLPIVKRMVEDHGGTIDVASTKDVGTTFKIQLPIRRDASETVGDIAGQSGAGHPGLDGA